MSLKIRLRKVSPTSKKRYNYRIVVVESTRPRDGRSIEELGSYDPAKSPAQVKIKMDRLSHWLKVGAQPTQTVKSLVKKLKKSEL